MNKSQLKIPLTILVLLFPILAMVVCFKLLPKGASSKLINNVDTVALFKIFDSQPHSPRVEERGVDYQVRTDKSDGKTGVTGRVLIGIFPTAQAAHGKFVGLSLRPVADTKIPDAKIGSEFKCWYGLLGKKSGNCLLRLDNCVLSFSYEGTLEDMIALARKVDAGLQDEAVAQRGELNVPQLSMSWPKQVRTGSRFKITVSSSSSGKIVPLLANKTDSAQPITTSQFSLYERAPQSAGPFARRFVLATVGNMILTETVQLTALSKQQADAE